jgi:hypothetical protein
VESNGATFLHLFIFQCPQCGSPICEFELREERSLEPTDASSFRLKCHECGQSDDSVGILARKRWVALWPDASRAHVGQ